MRERTFLQRWSHRYWLVPLYLLCGVFLVWEFVAWPSWSMVLRLSCAIVWIVPLHVLEEWFLPGGFHYQMNLLRGSKEPNTRPMNEFQDMLTNLGATVYFAFLTLLQTAVGPLHCLLFSLTIFGCVETIIHTVLGASMLKRFHKAGKRTFYGPGSVTAYLLFLPVGVLAIRELVRTGLAGTDVLFGILLILPVLFLIAPIMALTDHVAHKYPFPSARYFEKFLKQG